MAQPRPAWAVGVLLAGLAACGGGGGTGPPAERFDRVQLEHQTYGSLLPTGPGIPLILFDSTPVPAEFVSSLQLRGTLLTPAGTVDSTPGTTITWGIQSGGGSLATSTTEAVGGVVENEWFLGPMTPGSVQGIVLTSPEVPTYQQTIRLRVYQGPMQFDSSPADAAGSVGETLPEPFVVRVLDGNGVPLPRVLVRFMGGTLAYENPTVSAVYQTCNVSCTPGEPVVFSYTDATGRATVRLTLPTHATTAGLGVQPEAPRQLETSRFLSRIYGPSWTIPVAPGPTAQIVIQSGNNQAGSPGGTLALPLLVTVADQYGNPRVDEPVTWTVVTGGGSVGSPVTATNTLGLTSNSWTLGPAAGSQTVSATAGPATVTFSASAAATP